MDNRQAIEILTEKILNDSFFDIDRGEYYEKIIVPMLNEMIDEAEDITETIAQTLEYYQEEEEAEPKSGRVDFCRKVTNNYQIRDFKWAQKIKIQQENPHRELSNRAVAYDITKSATTIGEYRALAKDAKLPRFYLNFKYDIQRDYITLDGDLLEDDE